NVGLNLGRPAGGSVSEHLHVHVVPRWTGDSNFMTTVANTRTLPEPLVDTAAKLRAARPPPAKQEAGRIMDAPDAGELRDELPDDLVAAGYVGPYKFPDNSRRGIPGVIYLAAAAICLVAFLAADDSVLVNGGFAWAALILAAAGVMSITSGWRMTVTETDALVRAQQAVGFPVGHASAQQVWHG